MKIFTLLLRSTLLLFAAPATTLSASVSVEDLEGMLEDQLAEKTEKKHRPAPQPPAIVFEQPGGEGATTVEGTLSPFPALMAQVMDTPPSAESGVRADSTRLDGKDTAEHFDDKISGASSAGEDVAAAEGGSLERISRSTEGMAHGHRHVATHYSTTVRYSTAQGIIRVDWVP